MLKNIYVYCKLMPSCRLPNIGEDFQLKKIRMPVEFPGRHSTID